MSFLRYPAWMTKDIGTPLFSWCLCVNEAQYRMARRQLAKEGKFISWAFPEKGALCQFIATDGEITECVVCLKEVDDPIINAARLVHEAVHIWRKYAESLDEKNPSEEFMAYTIQNISQILFYAYQRILEEREKK